MIESYAKSRAAAWLRRGWAACRALAAAALLGAVLPAAAFHFPWDQGHDTTGSNDPPPPGPCGTAECDPCNEGGTHSPVYAATGHCVWSDTDVVLRGRPYIGVMRTFNSNDPVTGLFGNGWTIDFDVALYPANAAGVQQRIYKAPNGKRFIFVKQADGSYLAPASRFETIVEGASNVTMSSLDGSRMVFALNGNLLERRDANGNRVSFRYDSAGRTIGMADDNGRSVAMGYNAAGLIESVTDHGGRIWRYAYDAGGNLVTITDPLGGVMRYQYQGFRPSGDAFTYSQLTRVVDAGGVEVVAFTYSGAQVASYNEGANTYTYTRPISNTITGGTVTRTDRTGAREVFLYGTKGLVTRDTDALNFVRNYSYDANGKRITETDELNGNWATGYDTLGRLTSRTNPLGQATAIAYDGLGSRPVRFTSPTGRVTQLTYDPAGNLLTLTDAAGGITRMAYNAQGDATSVTDALGGVATTSYNAAGQPLTVTDPLGRISRYEYDALGRVTKRTNPAGEATSFAYDALDRVTAITDAAGNTISMSYDAAGRILRVADQKGSASTFAYDSFGRLSSETAPDGRITSYAYRLDNLLSAVTRADGTSVSYAYDAKKRITSETAGGETITYTYNGRDDLLSASGAGGSVSYTYDAAGRVISETTNGRTLSFTRNAEGERTQSSLQGGGITQFGRDARGLVTQITAGPGSFTYTRDALGRRTRLGLPNGSSASWAFDAAGQLQSLSHDGAFNAQLQYSYDAAGRILNIAGAEAGWAYAYDRLGRVVSATRGSESYAYVYDAVGNLLGNGAQHDASHRLTQDDNKNYSYDTRGNLVREQHRVSGAIVAYTWNTRNQLTKVEFFPSAAAAATRTVSFTYDAMGRRASKTDSGVTERYVYDGFDLVATLNAGGSTLATNTFGPAIDDPLATVAANGARFYHADHLGSVMALSNAAAATTTRYQYDPYGATTITGEAPAASFAYTGREKDTDELYFYRSRYYNTSYKRFLSEDRIGLSGGVNLYGFVDGDPINSTDPLGECPWCVWAAGQYARCVAACALQSAAMTALTGGCLDAGDILGDCALDCLNPLNWGGKGKPGIKNNALPKPPRGKGSVPPSQRDPKRTWTKEENTKKLEQQGGNCANCGQKTDINDAAGHHIDRHADGGQTNSDNHAVVCNPCHKDLHGKGD